MTPQEVLEYAKTNDAKQLDLRFTDIPSLQHHVSYPINQLDESSFEEGFGMDGSSIRGWAAIHESDMLLVPTHHRLHGPLRRVRTLVMYGDVKDPDHQAALRSAPALDRPKGRLYLKQLRASADTAVLRRRSEFFIFDNISLRPEPASGYYYIDAEEGPLELRAAARTTLATVRATRKAPSRCRPPTTTRTCAARWCRP
jgi:glutamine synthetase